MSAPKRRQERCPVCHQWKTLTLAGDGKYVTEHRCPYGAK